MTPCQQDNRLQTSNGLHHLVWERSFLATSRSFDSALSTRTALAPTIVYVSDIDPPHANIPLKTYPSAASP
jgi:hypothetical protein